MSNVICKKDGHTLVRPFNTWDTNYHLYDTEGNDHLIDIEDIQETMEELDERGGMLWDDFKVLFDIDEVKELAWEVQKADKESTQFWDILSTI